MGWAYYGSLVLAAGVLVHLRTVEIDEPEPEPSSDMARHVDVRGALDSIRAVPGLFMLILLAAFNNLLAGVFLATASTRRCETATGKPSSPPAAPASAPASTPRSNAANSTPTPTSRSPRPSSPAPGTPSHSWEPPRPEIGRGAPPPWCGEPAVEHRPNRRLRTHSWTADASRTRRSFRGVRGHCHARPVDRVVDHAHELVAPCRRGVPARSTRSELAEYLLRRMSTKMNEMTVVSSAFRSPA